MFEKIYLTILIIQLVLSFFIVLFGNNISINIVVFLLKIQAVFIIGYWIVKIIGLLWGFNIDLFPNIDFVEGGK